MIALATRTRLQANEIQENLDLQKRFVAIGFTLSHCLQRFRGTNGARRSLFLTSHGGNVLTGHVSSSTEFAHEFHGTWPLPEPRGGVEMADSADVN